MFVEAPVLHRQERRRQIGRHLVQLQPLADHRAAAADGVALAILEDERGRAVQRIEIGFQREVRFVQPEREKECAGAQQEQPGEAARRVQKRARGPMRPAYACEKGENLAPHAARLTAQSGRFKAFFGPGFGVPFGAFRRLWRERVVGIGHFGRPCPFSPPAAVSWHNAPDAQRAMTQMSSRLALLVAAAKRGVPSQMNSQWSATGDRPASNRCSAAAICAAES